ncbi:hypothetical protein F5X97DRAFT_307774 [Nemania serpens]|nr:hypothetical protein F5X97DRAFT_307774 [Nemania serpens]
MMNTSSSLSDEDERLQARHPLTLLKGLHSISFVDFTSDHDELSKLRARITPSDPLRFLPSTQEAGAIATDARSLFFLSSKPDYFVTTSIRSEAEQGRMRKQEKHYGDVIQRLAHSNVVGDNHTNGILNLPQYISQLGRLVSPGPDPLFAYKLPFVAVIDVLDPLKSVWLVHVKDIAEDPEEEEDWYPPAYVLEQLDCLFVVSKQRDPVYHIARVARSLREWADLDWPSAMGNIQETRRRGTFEIRVAWAASFRASVDKLRRLQ